MKKILAVFFLLLMAQHAAGQSDKGILKVTPNGHYLQFENGKPFFWLGDTGWNLFLRLTIDEITKYLDNRKAKGFNVIQAVILAETDGLRVPNKYGDVPLINMDPAKPNENYFKLVDSVVKLAAERNMIMALLPAWGDKVTLHFGGHGPVIFNKDNAYTFAQFLGKRYRDHNNIVWVLGGDRPPKDDCNNYIDVYRAMAKGLKDGSGKNTIISFHPGGSIWETSPVIHNEKWMDYNMIQSGHSALDAPVWRQIWRDWYLQPTKPVIDSEPCYEDHPVNPWPTWDPARGYFRDYEVRKQLYRSVFAGGFGVTYGHHAIWQFYNPTVEKINYPDRYWYEALDRPGAYHAGYLKKLVESRPYNQRIPDSTIVINGQATENAEHIEAFRDEQGRYLMVYLPVGKKITVRTAAIPSKKINAYWFNPKDMKVMNIKGTRNTQQLTVEPPTTGKGNDWVLVVDDASQKFKAPSK